MDRNQLLKSHEFKKRVREADDLSSPMGIDRWSMRVVWVGLIYNVKMAKRFAQRRSNYTESKAWKAYSNLINAGVFSEDPEGIIYNETPKYETDEGVMEWLFTLCSIANGEEVPQGFPCNRQPHEAPFLRVVEG